MRQLFYRPDDHPMITNSFKTSTVIETSNFSNKNKNRKTKTDKLKTINRIISNTTKNIGTRLQSNPLNDISHKFSRYFHVISNIRPAFIANNGNELCFVFVCIL